MAPQTADVVIIGGGPAGAAAGALLAKHGVSVELFECERFPRHHVGESLQPALFQLLDHHFGLGPKFATCGFALKFGALYVWGESRKPWSVLFDPRLERDLPSLDAASLVSGGYEHAWQVDRAQFDTVLLENARAHGAHVHEGVEISGLVLDGPRVVGVRCDDGTEIRAGLVLDASGQRCVVGRHFGLVDDVPDLRATATYAYYDGAGGVAGPLGRHVQLLVTVPEGWVWFIPISPDRTSVGVVVRERSRLDLARFGAIVEASGVPLGKGSLVNPADPLFHVRDWSYALRRSVGPGWIAIGDAACFVDPILSGGVDFAVRGGLNAATAYLRVREGSDEQPTYSELESRLRREYRAYLRLARYWYQNNRSVDSFFWEAHAELADESLATPLRAFVYLTSGRYAADNHFRVFQQWQEEKMFRALGVDPGTIARAIRERGR